MQAEIHAQNEMYLKMGLNREEALRKIDSVCISIFGKPYSEHAGMWSEHLVLLAAISVENVHIKKILEIGTFKGETTLVIRRLFPNSAIETVDLNRQEIINQGIYSYAVDEITTTQKNFFTHDIEFKIMNSLQLINENSKYDLIWVDGSHTSPVSTIDIANSIRLLSAQGIAICDDVYLERYSLDPVSDLSSIQTLNAFQESEIISFTLIKKRIAKKFNSFPVKPKYLGIYRHA
jgi:predicted O-methyltransferase YrrM